MTNPLHAAFYADHLVQTKVAVTENVPVARSTFRLRFECPPLARRILPGQFIMLRLAECNDPLVGRPLALYDTVRDAAGEPWGIDVVYLAQGKLTRRLASLSPGAEIEAWGPLGNGFDFGPVPQLIMVAGGIGQTPFLALAQERLGLRHYGEPLRDAARSQRVTLCYGARSDDLFAGLGDFEAAGVELALATDDGTRGHRGFVTEVLEKRLASLSDTCHVVCCGPEPMMAATARLASQYGVTCQVSLETPMACGIGVCFTCVAKVQDAQGNWDYKRTCVDGPVFDASKIVW